MMCCQDNGLISFPAKQPQFQERAILAAGVSEPDLAKNGLVAAGEVWYTYYSLFLCCIEGIKPIDIE